jgi:predicted nucleic acid-binding protein
MRRLLDTNTWIALTVETHAQHATARRWYDAEPLTPGDLLFCRATEISFLRLITQARVMNACGLVPLTNAEAIDYLDNVHRDPAVAHADEPPQTRALWLRLAAVPLVSPKRLDGRLPRGLRHRAGCPVRHLRSRVRTVRH